MDPHVRFGDLAFALVLVAVAIAAVVWAESAPDPVAFPEQARRACIEHGGVRQADRETGVIVCLDGWVTE